MTLCEHRSHSVISSFRSSVFFDRARWHMLRHARGNCFCLLFCSTNWYMLLTCMCYSLMFKDLPAGCWMPKNNEQQHPGLSKQNFLSRCILALEFAEIRTRFYGDNTAFHLNSFTCLITFLLLVILAPWGQNVTVSCNRKHFFLLLF